MTAEPHPQRCETCTNQSCHYHPNNNYWKDMQRRELLSFFYDAIDIVGCVSHSDVKSEQEIRKKVPIICLCGSTRFTREMLVKQWELTKQGYIVVSWCALPDDYYNGVDKAHIGDQEGVKAFVDGIHKRKIDISDEVLVIDINGYIGTSTRSEIYYAIKHGKPVRYLSEELRSSRQE